MSVYYPGPQKWGYTYSYKPDNVLKVTDYNTSGQPTSTSTQTYTQAFKLMLRRDYRSSNPVQFILPQKVPWRRPSSYVRTAAIVTYDEGTYLRRNPLTGTIIRSWSGKGPQVSPTTVFGPYISASYEAILDANTRNRLNTEVLLKLKDMKVNIGEALAEMRSTVRGVSSTFSQLASAALAARRGNWAGVARSLGVKPKSLASGGAFSERWLEYQFGWLPLMSDLKGTHDVLRDGLRNKGLIFSASRSYTDSRDFSSSSTNWEIKGHTTVQGRVKVYAAVSDAVLANATSLGLLDPLQVGWALVPYSFVVDWFMPVGNLLEAVGATRGLTFVGGFTSVRVSSEASWKYVPEATLGAVYEGEGFTGNSQIDSYTRTSMSTFPSPSLYLKSPFSTTHLVDALALLRQLIKSK